MGRVGTPSPSTISSDSSSMWKASPYPEVFWDSELKAEDERWKGTAACIAIGFLFLMTLGLIYWQVVDQPHKHWIIPGRFTGIFWDSSKHSLVFQTLSEDRPTLQVSVGPLRDSDSHVYFWGNHRNKCWPNSSRFCAEWDGQLKASMVLESDEESNVECYNISWTPLHCRVDIKHCFSMEHVFWYGGGSVQPQRWPLNPVNIPLQLFTPTDLTQNPSGFGSVLEHRFFGSSGVAVLLSPDVPLNVGIERNQQFCVQPQRTRPLQYRVCVGPSLKVVHQKIAHEHSLGPPQLPDRAILRAPIWKLVVDVDSGVKLEKELRTFANRLKRHHLNSGIISLDQHSTSLLLKKGHSHSHGANRNLLLVQHLNISATFTPYVSVSDRWFPTSLQTGNEGFWLSRPTTTQGHAVPLTSQWKGDICVKLNISNPAALSWFLEQVGNWSSQLGAEFVILEAGETSFSDGLPEVQASQDYIQLLATLAGRIGRTAILTSGSGTSDVPLFVMMAPLHGSWTYTGIKGIIPAVLHYSLLGYNFFIADAIGGSLTDELITDEELFIRWLEIVTFLPVMSFQTPPWSFSEFWILNFTNTYLSLHHEFVVPLIMKYAQEWTETRNPIYRPLWWISPEDPITFTIDDEFLIGSEVLIAPVTEDGARKRNVYLPGAGMQWRDRWTGEVFDGGTLLQNFPVELDKVAIFYRIQ